MIKIASFGIAIALFVSAIGTPALAAPANTGAYASPTNIRDFARCFIADMKIMPRAKKLSPQGYQDLEKILTTSFNATALVHGNPYWDAILLGAKIGKFIGYDFIWYVGAVQDCWSQLRR